MQNNNTDIFSIPHSISLINSWLDDEIRIGLKSLDIKDIVPNYAPILKILEAHGGEMPISYLAEKSQNSKPYVTQMVNILEKSGYIIRGTDPKDKRISLVKLTEKGYETQEKIAQLIKNITLKKFPDFNVEELQILALLLNKVSRVMV